jgi:heat shock protein HslJ
MPTTRLGAQPATYRPVRRSAVGLLALALALILVILIPGVSRAAAPQAAPPAAELEGAPWRLVSYAASGGRLLPVLPGTEVTATFQGGQVNGSAGCNQYNAGYQLAPAAGLIRFTPAAATQRFCPDPPGVMQQEAAYLQNLERVARYTLAGDDLTLRDAAGAVLLSYTPQPQAPLVGTDWVAESYNNGQEAVVSVVAGTEITARFAAGGLAGSAGCNPYLAGYTAAGTALTITLPVSTRRACPDPPGVMQQEAAYLAALPTAARYRIEGDRLTLERDDGARVATYTARGAGGERLPTGLPRTGSAPGTASGTEPVAHPAQPDA